MGQTAAGKIGARYEISGKRVSSGNVTQRAELWGHYHRFRMYR